MSRGEGVRPQDRLAETYKERIPGRGTSRYKGPGLSMEEGSEARTQRLVRKADQPRVRCYSEKASSGLSWKQDGKTLRGAGQQESVSQEVPLGLSRMDVRQQWERGA